MSVIFNLISLNSIGKVFDFSDLFKSVVPHFSVLNVGVSGKTCSGDLCGVERQKMDQGLNDGANKKLSAVSTRLMDLSEGTRTPFLLCHIVTVPETNANLRDP